MNVSTKDIQLLRKSTGSGIMDCKNALLEANGDMDVARDILRKKGLASAAKKASREANDGLVGIRNSGNIWVILELNSETDFVAKNDFFQNFFNNTLDLIIDNSDVENIDQLMQIPCPWNQDRSLVDTLAETISVIKENIKIARFNIVKCSSDQEVFSYIHNKCSDNIGKIGVLLHIENPKKQDFSLLGKQICMHIASAMPMSIDIESLSSEYVEKERFLFIDQLKDSKKPDNIIEKIVDGKIRKVYEDCVLLEQAFIFDNKVKIKDLFNNAEFKDVKILNFDLYKISN